MHQETSVKLSEATEDRRELRKQLDLANENIIESLRGISQANSNIRGVQTTLDKTSSHSVPPEHVRRKDSETYSIYYTFQDEAGKHYIQCRARPFHLRRREKELQERFPLFRQVLAISPVPNARSLASEFERRIQELGALFDLKYQEVSLPLDCILTEEGMVEIAREVFEERKEPAVQATEAFAPISVDFEEGKITVEAEPEQPPTGPTYDERFAALLANSALQLKEVARAFPRDLKTYGGWSGKNKTDLAHWILRRQGFTP